MIGSFERTGKITFEGEIRKIFLEAEKVFWVGISLAGQPWSVHIRLLLWLICLLQLCLIKISTISSPLRSSIAYLHGTVFLAFFITKNYFKKVGVQHSTISVIYFIILTWATTLKLESLLLFQTAKPIYVNDLISATFISV